MDFKGFLNDYFSRKNGVPRSIRGLLLALAGALATPQGQAILAAALGKYAWLAPVIMAALGGLVSVGEKNDDASDRGDS